MFLLAVIVALLSVSAFAGHHAATDFPLRVHIYNLGSHSHYYGATVSYVDGEGRGNLYENSEAHGFDFSYRCDQRMLSSAGYETYMARWKKPGAALEILIPVMGGAPNDFHPCELKIALKEDSAYATRNGSLGLMPVAKYRDWMKRVDYDPEHGKNIPVAPPAKAPASQPAASPNAQSAAPAALEPPAAPK
jgi:hypothetical protein